MSLKVGKVPLIFTQFCILTHKSHSTVTPTAPVYLVQLLIGERNTHSAGEDICHHYKLHTMETTPTVLYEVKTCTVTVSVMKCLRTITDLVSISELKLQDCSSRFKASRDDPE